MKHIKEFNLFEYNLNDPFGEEISFFEKKDDPDYIKLKRNLIYLASNDPNFIIYKLGMREIIDNIFDQFKINRNLNKEYQIPFKYLYDTKKYPEIEKRGNEYYCKRFEIGSIMVDENGEWVFANKLNTNYSDLAVLLADLFYYGKLYIQLADYDTEKLKFYLMGIKNHIPRLILKYFTVEDLKQYTEHIKKASAEGELAEDIIEKCFIDMGWKILYRGGNGDFIDMIFGVDIIVQNKNGDIRTIQVKSSRYGARKAMTNSAYTRIDMILYPQRDGFEGIQRKIDGIIKTVKYNC